MGLQGYGIFYKIIIIILVVGGYTDELSEVSNRSDEAGGV